MSEKVSAIVLDLGRVVFDLDFELIWKTWSRISGVDAQVLQTRFESGQGFPNYDNHYRDYERGLVSTENYLAHFNRQLATTFDMAEFLQGWNAMFTEPIEGMRELLLQIKSENLPLYAFSNTNADHEVFWRQRYASSIEQFDEIFTSHGLGHRKPDLASFQAVLTKIDLPAQQILFFDDLEGNVAGARTAGMQAELFVDTARTRDLIAAATERDFTAIG